MPEAVIVDTVRTPIGRAFKGSLSQVRPDETGAFVIDQLRCVVCGLCVEACPKDAIRMDTYQHTPPEYTREGFVYPIERLLKGPPVSHPSDPWLKRKDSAQPKDQVFPLIDVAKHSTEPVEQKPPLPQGKHHPEPPVFTEEEVRKANAG